MTKEALTLALEALETLHDENMDYIVRNKLGGENNQCMVFARDVIKSIKRTLAQPEQKPFAWYAIEHGEADIEWNSQRPIYEGNWKPLYRTPPQRTEQEQQIETLNRCLFQMQEAAKDLVKQAKSLPSTQRTWVGLTDEEIDFIDAEITKAGYCQMKFTRAIEAKLKEKNT